MGQMKHSVTYRDNEKETEIFEWVESKSEIIGPSNAIKQILYNVMMEEKKEENKSNDIK